MATKVNVNGKLVTRPGVYTLIKSGIQNNPGRTNYGVVTIIDDGVGAGFGGGKAGEVFSFDSIQDFRSFVKGGELWDLAEPLFKPVKNNNLIKGASKVNLIHAREATPSAISFTFANGTLVLTTKDEGVNSVGTNIGGKLKRGYAATFSAGKTALSFIIRVYHGTDAGLSSDGDSYSGIAAADSKPLLVVESGELTSIADIKAFVAADALLNAGFVSVVTGTGLLETLDLTTNSGNIYAIGGTELYDITAFQAAIQKAKGVDTNFFLATKSGGILDDSNNQLILSDIITTSKYEKFLVIGGGQTAAELDSLSILAAKFFNSDKVIIVHGDGLIASRANTYKRKNSLWKAANVLGRLAGLEPQSPLTLKRIGLDKESNPLTEKQQEAALAAGVVVTYFDEELGYDVVLQGINTLQLNGDLVNADGSSFSITVKRITAQLNKEVAIYLKRKFFGNDNVGPNRNTVTEDDIVAATEGYLQKRTASSNQDDLIISFRNITAVVDGDVYRANYEFVPNFEINIFIITGTIFDK